jgi:hypothetical protein
MYALPLSAFSIPVNLNIFQRSPYDTFQPSPIELLEYLNEKPFSIVLGVDMPRGKQFSGYRHGAPTEQTKTPISLLLS